MSLPANAEGSGSGIDDVRFCVTSFPVQPDPDDLAKLNEALRELLGRDPEIKAILDKYPAYTPMVRATPMFGGFGAPGGEIPSNQQLLAAGWGYAMIDPSSIQADNGAGLTRGIIGLVNKGQPRKPDDWGSLRAWAWGAARGLDYLETDPSVDSKRVGIEGVSRYGKAALVTMAFEPRFAMVLVGSSGKGGATLHRRVFGEAVESLTASGEYHWMAGNYLKYGAEKGAFGSMNASHTACRFAHADCDVCSAAGIHQLWHTRKGRCQMARPEGKLYGHGCRRICFQTSGSKGSWRVK